jgi:hypothetical protein
MLSRKFPTFLFLVWTALNHCLQWLQRCQPQQQPCLQQEGQGDVSVPSAEIFISFRSLKSTDQGKSVTVAITDRCTGCALTDLDFSPSAFDQLADESIGRLSGMTWDWLDL